MIKKIILWTFPIFFLSACSEEEEYIYPEQLPNLTDRTYAGGQTTVFSENSLAYSVPATNLSAAQE